MSRARRGRRRRHLCGLEREPACKDTQAGKQVPLLVGQKLVTPFQRVPNRALTFGHVTGAAGQQLQPVAETVEHRLRGHSRDSRRSELDGERETVEPRAELADGLDVRSELEVGAGGLRTDGEQLDGLVLDRERRNRVDGFAAEPKGLPARREDSEAVSLRAQLGELRRRIEDLLEVVEHQQQLLVGDVGLEGLDACARHAEGLRDGR